MGRKRFILLVVLGILGFTILFFWNSVRPSIIKSDCSKWAREQEGNYERYYEVCLKDEGL